MMTTEQAYFGYEHRLEDKLGEFVEMPKEQFVQILYERDSLRSLNAELASALRNVRGYIKECDHEPALGEIDAALAMVKEKK